MHSLKTRILVLATLVTLAIASAAVAANPHFVGKVKASISPEGDVTVSWKEAGLGDNQNIDYLVGAEATATYHCVNGGGQCPNAANKQTVEGPVGATGTFASGQNGQITASLTFGPPLPDPPDFCPSGQTATLTEVSYSGIFVSDLTNGISASAVPSSISAVLFVCP